MTEGPDKLETRTRGFALHIVRLCQALPNGKVADVLDKQLLRSGTSVGANYRAACRGRSRAEFVAKLGIVEEELDECLYWMDLICEAKLIDLPRLDPLMTEASELLAMTVASIRTARAKKAKR